MNTKKSNSKKPTFTSGEKVKTTLLLDKTLKKFAQLYAVEHETTLQSVVEEGLKTLLLSKK